jgi:hypothetical protein
MNRINTTINKKGTIFILCSVLILLRWENTSAQVTLDSNITDISIYGSVLSSNQFRKIAETHITPCVPNILKKYNGAVVAPSFYYPRNDSFDDCINLDTNDYLSPNRSKYFGIYDKIYLRQLGSDSASELAVWVSPIVQDTLNRYEFKLAGRLRLKNSSIYVFYEDFTMSNSIFMTCVVNVQNNKIDIITYSLQFE